MTVYLVMNGKSSMEYSTTTPGTGMHAKPAIQPVRSLFTAILLLWMLQLGIMAWFMVGQGYDRATAALLPRLGLLAIPLMALLIRAGMPRAITTRLARFSKAMLQAGALYAMSLLLPGWIILYLMNLESPFSELWWILGASTAVLVGLLTVLKAPRSTWWLFAGALAGSAIAGILLVRTIVFSFF